MPPNWGSWRRRTRSVTRRKGGDLLGYDHIDRPQRQGLRALVSSWFSGSEIRPRRRHKLRAGERVYAVGDIHGCSRQLDALLARITSEPADGVSRRFLVFLGDYIDRGPDSKGVIERLLTPPAGFETSVLRGNHDQTLLDFLADPVVYRVWREFGGRDTLMSYGVEPPLFDQVEDFERARNDLAAALPIEHRQFLEGLQPSVSIGGYYFTHAGVRPGVALESQTSEDLMWIRDDFLNSRQDFGAIVVHGHTPTAQPVVKRNRIGVDTGAYATGCLTAAVLDGDKCRFISVR
ncbi:MAG: serine/threonine protein phosphatase [Alphaproteobacteria bacterium]|nr:serine/threonine protein phosphatase [Alphaproteobacteria bacterium]